MSIRYRFHSEKSFVIFPLNGRKGIFVKQLREYIEFRRNINVNIINIRTQSPYLDTEWLRRSTCVVVKNSICVKNNYREKNCKDLNINGQNVNTNINLKKIKGIPKNITINTIDVFDDNHLKQVIDDIDILKCEGDAIFTISTNFPSTHIHKQ